MTKTFSPPEAPSTENPPVRLSGRVPGTVFKRPVKPVLFGTNSISCALMLVWIYYSTQILFFGAEFTQVYANKYGSKIAPEGEENSAQPESKGIRDLKGQPALPAPAAVAISNRENQLEKENRQTARFLLGLAITSFFTGVFTTIFGLKKR